MNIFKNKEQEKTNKDKETDTLIRRYSERHQREKIKRNERALEVVITVRGEKYWLNTAESILPPSKSNMGIRFRSPRKRDEKEIYERNIFFIGYKKIKQRILTNGPAAQSKISFLNDMIDDAGLSAAPKMLSDNSFNSILKIFATATCPSSCRMADMITATENVDEDAKRERSITVTKMPVLIFILSPFFI